MRIIKTRGDAAYKPLPLYVLDPLEYVALGLHYLKQMNGEKKWEQCHRDRKKHPDWQKLACVAHGALIYTAPFPERTHKPYRPPLDWKLDAGITDAVMHEAKMHLMEEDPAWEAKRALRESINEHMDANAK